MQDWRAISEQIVGLVKLGKLSPTAIEKKWIHPETREYFSLLKDGKELSEIIMSVANDIIITCDSAGKSAMSVGGVDWIPLIRQSYADNNLATFLAKSVKDLTAGRGVSVSKIKDMLARRAENVDNVFVKLNEITAVEAPLIPCGIAPLDKWLGGIAKEGITVFGGFTKSGKTSFALALAERFSRMYGKVVAFFTLEMGAGTFKYRSNQVTNYDGDEHESHVWVSDRPLEYGEIIALSSGIENLGMIIVDYVDLSIHEEVNVGNKSTLYKAFLRCAKELRIPIILLEQLSRQEPGLPKPTSIKYASTAEQTATAVFMAYNPDNDPLGTEILTKSYGLPVAFDVRYLCVYFNRFRHENSKDLQFPGVLEIAVDSKTGAWDLDNPGIWRHLQKKAGNPFQKRR